MLAVPGHVGRDQTAELRAIDIERDAAGHGFRVGLGEATCHTVIAGIGTGITGLDARSKLLMSHFLSP
jgi:hypothetical protein